MEGPHRSDNRRRNEKREEQTYIQVLYELEQYPELDVVFT